MSDEPDTEEYAKWQPVMVYLRGGGRLECFECGALAIVVLATLGKNGLVDVSEWCQSCYVKAQREEMERQ